MSIEQQIIFDNKQKQSIETLIKELNSNQLAWLGGYLTAFSQMNNQPPSKTVAAIEPMKKTGELTILYGSRTGNGKLIAEKTMDTAQNIGLEVTLCDMNDFPLAKLKEIKNLFVIVSTHGEGVPPIAAEEFYNYLFGKKAPKLTNTNFSVLALGDKSYVNYCQTGKDVDKRLEELGGKRLFNRVDCDLELWESANVWIKGALAELHVGVPEFSEHECTCGDSSCGAEVVYNKSNPYPAKILDRIKLNGRGSEKETVHLEFSIEDSGFEYEPGDAIGVYSRNSERLTDALISKLKLDANEEILIGDLNIPVRETLLRNYELSVITADTIERYNAFAKSEFLTTLLEDHHKLAEFIYGRDVLDLITEFPVELTAVEFISVLRKLSTRLYSIASSLLANPDEVHLTVSAVRYDNGRTKEGVCSTFLADRVGDDDLVNIYLEKNPEFRLPVNPETPIIMVGPGTGIAPFRAFIQHREAIGAKGKNWLFYGDRHFETDFLYQTELQNFIKKGVLTKLNVAFSRDSEKKVYVQDKMRENAAEIFKWLEEGANFYVCGDMKHMWNDVNKTLLDIISIQGGISMEKADEYLRDLKKNKRYLVDVY